MFREFFSCGPALAVGVGFSLVASFTACASSSSSSSAAAPPNDDSGSLDPKEQDAGESKAKLDSHPLCSETGAKVPATFGTACAMGSNRTLCAKTASECGDDPCLWDGNATSNANQQGAAYCTIACDPAASNACPTGYTCKPHDCTSEPTNVCVRVAAPPSKPVCKDMPTGFLAERLEQAYDGRVYALGALDNANPAIFTRTRTDATWTLVHKQEEAFALTLATEHGIVVRNNETGFLNIEGTEATFEPCTACDRIQANFSGLYRTTEGRVRGIYDNSQIIERDGSGRWGLIDTPQRDFKDAFKVIRSFRRGGFFGKCWDKSAKRSFSAFCIGDKGDDTKLVSVPDGANFDLAIGGALDDFYGLSKGTLYHWTGEAFFKEGVSETGIVVPPLLWLEDGTLVTWHKAKDGDPLTMFALENGACWRDRGRITNGYAEVSLSGKTVGRLSFDLGRQFCEGTLP